MQWPQTENRAIATLGLLASGSSNQRKRCISLSSGLMPTMRNAFSISAVRPIAFQRNLVNISKIRGMQFSPTSTQSFSDRSSFEFFADPSYTMRTLLFRDLFALPRSEVNNECPLRLKGCSQCSIPVLFRRFRFVLGLE